MEQFFETTERPNTFCKICNKQIEPIKTKSGYLKYQPSICSECLTIESEALQRKRVTLRKLRIREIAISRNLPRKFAEEVNEDFPTKIYRQFVEDNQSLFIRGKPGSGKTYFAAWLFMTCLKEYPLINEELFYYTSLLDVDSKIRKDWNEDEILSKCKTKYLFFQFGDIAQERIRTNEVSAWLDELFFKIVDYRYNNKLPTVWISRLTDEELKSYDSATIGRIMETSIQIQIDGDNHRRIIAKNNKPITITNSVKYNGR